MKKHLVINSILAFVLIMSLFGCKEYVYVPIESVKTDSIYIVRERRDSVIMHDSVYMETYTKGDTIFQTKYKEFTKYVPRYIIDTMVNVKVDTLRIPTPYKVEVVKKVKYIPIYVKVFEWIGIVSSVLVILTLFIYIYAHTRTKG